jgi:hypothetical protein
VRQGGVLFPYLFSFYIDELVNLLRNPHVGCYFGQLYAGVIVYADDIVLLSPSIKGLRLLINLTNTFAISHKLKFNPTKSFCVRFNKFIQSNSALPSNRIDLDGTPVSWVNKVTHLGIVVTNNLDDTPHLSRLTADFYARVNSLFANMGFIRNPMLLHHIFQLLCCSFYGSPACAFNCRQYGALWHGRRLSVVCLDFRVLHTLATSLC